MQLSENIKMTNFHLTFLWIFPYNMGNNDRKGADPGMRKVDHNKQQKRESLLDSAFSLFIDNGFNKTSIADIVKNAGVAEKIADIIVQSPFPAILIPIIIAAIIHVVTGSNALGVMTAAALVEPMLATLGISPVAAFLACGTGALMFKHANSSGFWVTVSMSNMNVNQGIRGVGGASTVAGFTGAVVTCILVFLHII